MSLKEETIASLMEKATSKLENEGNHKGALKIHSKILSIDPENIDSLYSRGECYRMSDRFQLALKDLMKANELKPNHPGILSSLGSSQYRFGNLQDGIENLEKSLKLDPNDEWILQELGSAKSWNGNFEEALKYLNEANKLQPLSPFTLYQRGIVYRKLGKLKESLNDLRAALELKSTNNTEIIYIAELAQTFREMQLFETASELVSKLDDSFPVVGIVKAHIYIDNGNQLNEAENCLKKVETKLSDWQDIQNFKEIRELLLKKKQQENGSHNPTSLLVENSKQNPIKAIEQMTSSINTLQQEMIRLQTELSNSNLSKMNETLVECSKSLNSEFGGGAEVVLELKKNVASLKQEIVILTHRNKEFEYEITEYERKLLCMICMEKPRDTVVMPCMHFLFCRKCIHKHNKQSKQCPSCRQTSTGIVSCLLEGEEPIRNQSKEKEKEGEKEKNGNGKRQIEVVEIKEEEQQQQGDFNEVGNVNSSKRQKKI